MHVMESRNSSYNFKENPEEPSDDQFSFGVSNRDPSKSPRLLSHYSENQMQRGKRVHLKSQRNTSR
jgi:hypothetical protein